MSHATNVDNLAAGVIKDPARFADCVSYYEALITTLNATLRDGEQDALALFEAIAMMLGQMTGNLSRDELEGLLVYITERAAFYAEAFASAGKAAQFIEDQPPEKLHG